MARNRLGVLSLSSKSWEQAKTLFEGAISDFDHVPIPRADNNLDAEKATAFMRLAVIESHFKQFEEAQTNYSASIKCFDDGLKKDSRYLSCLNGKAQCLIVQAKLLHDLGKLDAAANCLRTSLIASQESSNVKRAMDPSSIDLLTARKFKNAELYKKEAKLLLKRLGQT